MLSPDERARYSRHLLLPEIGEEGQLRLKAASVLVVGVGGLGSPAAMYLAAAGVGRIGIADSDRVDASNLQRQIVFDGRDVGRPKTEAARVRLAAMNDTIEIVPHPAIRAENALGVIAEYDVVVDATDNFPTRYLLSDACLLAGKPDVYGAIFRFEGQVAVFDPARNVCYRCLHPDPPPPDAVPDCAEAGVLGVLPGIIGSLQAAEAVKLIAGAGTPLSGRLLLFDALEMTFRELKIPGGHDHAPVTKLIDYEGFCNRMDITARELSERMAQSDRDFVLVDVREPHEWEAGRIEGATHIPLRQVPARLGELPRGQEIVVYCRMGGRSANAQSFLRSQGFAKVRNLLGGINAWKREVDPSVKVV